MTRPEPANPTKDLLHLGLALAPVLRHACSRVGLDDTGARLIHHDVDVVCLLPAQRIVARINRADRARTALHLTRWLTDVHGHPATAPLPALEPVAVDDSTVVTFWAYYPQPHPRHRTPRTRAAWSADCTSCPHRRSTCLGGGCSRCSHCRR